MSNPCISQPLPTQTPPTLPFQATKALAESLDTLRAANVRAEPAVRALKRRKRLKEDIRLCGSKSAWLKHRSVERMLRDAEQVQRGLKGKERCLSGVVESLPSMGRVL